VGCFQLAACSFQFFQLAIIFQLLEKFYIYVKFWDWSLIFERPINFDITGKFWELDMTNYLTKIGI